MTEPFHKFVNRLIDDYLDLANKSFQSRMSAWNIDVFEKESNEVVGGLLARQLSLATTLAMSPPIWNMHVLPIVLRCMADVYITFCWVVADPKKRSRQFIEYGLGQEKLAIEKYRECLAEESEPDPEAINAIETRQKILEAERLSFLIPVNLGAWSEMSIRDMAKEVGEKNFYDLVFTQFSSAVHSTWQHIWRLNLYPCSNPLHMGHRLPFDPVLQPDPKLFTNSAKYLCKTFAKFDTAILGHDAHNKAYECYDLLWDRFADYFNKQHSREEKASKKKTPNRNTDSTKKVANRKVAKRGAGKKKP